MGNTRSAKLATFWCADCGKESYAKVEGRIPHLPEEAKVFQLPCGRCRKKLFAELIRVDGTIVSKVYGDNGVGDSC